jgi:glutamine cyclotransferase
MKKFLTFLLAPVFLVGCTSEIKSPPPETNAAATVKETPLLNFTLLKNIPHDTDSYTQGLLIHEGKWFESTGAPRELAQTKSVFGILDTSTGKIKVKATLDKNIYFGEGMVILNDKVYQLTWQNRIGFVYDARTFNSLGQFNIPAMEGWGLTTDGVSLIMSDGTNKLTWLDPSSFATIKTISVTQNGYAVDYLNELEFIKGFIYANVYMTNNIVKIDPATGKVTGLLDLTSLVEKAKGEICRRRSLKWHSL